MSASRIRALGLSDIPSITAMIRDSFDAKLWPFMTYTQPGIDHFLAILLRFPGATPATESFVMVEEYSRSVIGYADYRLLHGGIAHLSYICVAPEARGRGVASRLIANFWERHPEVERIQLDVFDGNSPAQSLYKKLGFREIGRSVWITRVLPPPHGHRPVNNLAFAIAAHESFGFCELLVPIGDVVKRFGLLGDSVIRVSSVVDFGDDSTLAALRAMFVTPSLAFSILPADELDTVDVGYDIINRSVRMTLVIDRESGDSAGTHD